MYDESSARERLKNGKAWLEYRSFDDNSFGALFKDVPMIGGGRVDLGRIDFKNEYIKTDWFYTDSLELEQVEDTERMLEELLEDNFLGDKQNWDYSRNFISDTEVTHSIMDAPRVHGQVLKADYEGIDESLEEFSEGVLRPGLSSREYESMWVEGERVFR